jgi:hypothetical protein
MDDLPHTEWRCEECNAVNSCLDGDCQFCDGPLPECDCCGKPGILARCFVTGIETFACEECRGAK